MTKSLSCISRVFIFVVILGSSFQIGKASAAFNFFVASDMRQYTGSGVYDTTSYFRGAAAKIAALDTLTPSEFLIVTGDLDPVDYTGNTQDITWTIDQYLGSGFTWYPVVGNHELPGGGTESYSGENMDVIRAMLGSRNGPVACDETTFSFDVENVHFVFLNEYCDSGGDTVTVGDVPDYLYNWLVADLAGTDKEHIFVIGHEPAYPQPDEESGRLRHENDSLNQFPENRDRFWALLSEYNVEVYFTGHTHNYSKYFQDGVWQIDTGHARGLGDVGAKSTFMRVLVDGSTVTYETYRDDMAGGAYTLTDTLVTATTQPVYRFWSDVLHRHFYTISAEERDQVIAKYPTVWDYEGEAFNVAPLLDGNCPTDTTTVYRFWSDILQGHFYTANETEKDSVISKWPDVWNYEGKAFCVGDSEGIFTQPVYRFWSDILQGHFYTASEAEKDAVISKWPDVWDFEGVAYWVE